MQCGGTAGIGGQGGNDVGASGGELVDHVAFAAGAAYVEAQARAQANHLQQVGDDPAQAPVAVEEGQRCGGVVDYHTHLRVLTQPAFLARRQVQLAVSQQAAAAGAPALEDIVAGGGGLGIEGQVDQRKQHLLVLAQGEAEPDHFVLAEVGHAQARQMALADQVVGGDGVADEHVGLLERHCIECLGG